MKDGQSDNLSTRELLVLALLTATPPLSTDLYLASFPRVRESLHTDIASVQLTMTAFLVGIGFGQVIWGPIADRVGRRTPLLLGCAAATLAAAVSALAPSVDVLIASRFIQALAGSAGLVIARAMISDRLTGFGSARALSLVTTLTAAAPIIAPVAGGLLIGVTTWRVVLGMLVALGAVQLLGAVTTLPETHSREHRTDRIRYANLLRVFARPLFVAYSLAQMLAFGAMMAYIASSPFVYQELMGAPTQLYGAGFAVNAMVMVLASTLSARRARRRIHPARTVSLAMPVMLAGALGALTIAMLDVPPWLLVVPFAIMHLGAGFTMGNLAALALDQTRDIAGAGSAVLGAQFFLFGGLVSPIGGIGGGRTAVPMAVTMTICLTLAAGAFWTGRSHARRRPHLDTGFDVPAPAASKLP